MRRWRRPGNPPNWPKRRRGGAIYALESDLAARGLVDSPLLAGTKIVDYAGFVDLTVAHSPVMAWL